MGWSNNVVGTREEHHHLAAGKQNELINQKVKDGLTAAKHHQYPLQTL